MEGPEIAETARTSGVSKQARLQLAFGLIPIAATDVSPA